MQKLQYDHHVKESIEEISTRIKNFLKANSEYTDQFERCAMVGQAIEDVKKAISQDYRRTSGFYSRANPQPRQVTADGLTQILNVDATSSISPVQIEAYQLRRYKPYKGAKTDIGYEKFIRHLMWNRQAVSHKEAVIISKAISKIDIDDNGMYDLENDNGILFKKYAPRIALLYSNIHSDYKRVLMLRPSEAHLGVLSYAIYTQIVSLTIARRSHGSVNMDRWDDYEAFNNVLRSMVVGDEQLVVHEEEIIGNHYTDPDCVEYRIDTPRTLFSIGV